MNEQPINANELQTYFIATTKIEETEVYILFSDIADTSFLQGWCSGQDLDMKSKPEYYEKLDELYKAMK